MTLTRKQLIERAAVRLGAKVGDIASGTSTSAVLTGLLDTTARDGYYDGALLFMLDATASGDQERTVNHWEDRTGTAHFRARATDVTFTSETYILVPKELGYTLKDFRDALNIALRETKRSYRWPIPLAPNQRIIPLSDLTWLMGADDLDKVMRSDNPNMVRNAEFSEWSGGLNSAPDGWTLTGASATVARATTGIRSGFAAKLTRASATTTLTQTIPLQLLEYLVRSPGPLSTIAIAAWVTTATASTAKVGINSTFSGFHTGGSYPEWLTTTFTPLATNTAITITAQLDVNSSNADWHGIYLVVGSAVSDTIKEQGDQAYEDREVNHRPRNWGAAPVVQLDRNYSGQLVLNTRRGWSTLTADTDTVDDQYVRALEAGMLCKLLEVRKPNQDRTRLDVILAEERDKWPRLTDNFVSKPVADEPVQVSVTGA